uniref:C-JID domain-containing protein n=1 Tax=Fagus sylvatica TaxID=28930 RepID=A0A2N9J4H8_FAGSY
MGALIWYRLLPRRYASRCLTDHHLPRLPPKAGSIRSNCLKELVLSGMSQLVGIRLNGIGCLSWLKHSTLCFPQGLVYQKLGYESSTGRKEDGSRTAVQIIIPGLEIPRWLSYQRLGNSVSIDLPPNLYNCTWMGFAVCASFNSPPSYDDEFGNPVKTFGLRARVIALGDMPHSHDYASEIFFNVKVAPKHIWLLYLSRDDWLATFDVI